MSRLGTAFLTIYDTKDGDSPTYVRYYSNYPGLLSEMGDPDDSPPNTTVGWTSFTTTAPSTAYWIAEKRTVGETVYGWILTAVQSKTGGLPFVKYEMLSTTAPTDPFGTGLSTWETHAIEAVEAFTGRNYTDPKEFGYGTTIVIDYANNATVSGTYKRDETTGTDEWEAPSQFIDGSLVVDGSIVAAKIAANSIDANKIVVTGSAAIETAAAAATRATGTLSDAATDAASKVAVVTDNIYTPNTTTIDGGAITSKSITAANIFGGTITANELGTNSVKATAIDIDGTIAFSDNASGIKFGKSSLADGTAGAFYGRGAVNGSNVAGFAISSSSSSFSVDSSGTFRMVNAKIYVGQPNVPTVYENPSLNGTASYTLSVVPGTTDLDIVVVGAGGGGQSNAAGDQPYQNSGAAGGYSRVRCLDSSGSVVKTIYAAGGAGATYSVQTNLNSGAGPDGEDSTHGTGGAGGPLPASTIAASMPGDGYRGSGGGSGGAYGSNGSHDAVANNSGEAGETEEASSIPSTTTSLVLEVGAGGAGGYGPNASTIMEGGDGGNGVIIITNPTGGGNEIDLEQMEQDIQTLKSGAPSWNYNAGATSSGTSQITRSFGSGGGWYAIKVGGSVASVAGQYYITGLLANDNSGGGTKQFSGISRYYFTGTPTVSGIYMPTNGSYRYKIMPFYWYKVS